MVKEVRNLKFSNDSEVIGFRFPENKKLKSLSRLLKIINLTFIIVVMVLITASSDGFAQETQRRPNIVIILADDMGYSDMGSFGSEIKTPNLDRLSNAGTRFTNFYTHASCSPTRSMLLSGVDTHLNGLGNMGEWTAPNQQWCSRV